MEKKLSNIDLEPLLKILTEETTPKQLARLLDDFLFEYMAMLIRIQSSNLDDKTIHERSELFIYDIRMLRDALLKCEK